MYCRVYWYVTYWFAAALTTTLASGGTHATSHGNENPTQQDQLSIHVKEWPDAEFIAPIANVTVAKGRDAVLACSLSHSNNHSVGWLRTNSSGEGSRVNTVLAMGKNIVILDTRFSVEGPDDAGSPVWKLNIKNVRPEDAGWYMAQISNTDPIKRQTAYLTVLEPPNIDDKATPSQYKVREGDPVEIECRANGMPTPNITWRRENGIFIANDSCYSEKDESSEGYGRFCLSKAERSAMGSYLCIASNGIAPITSKRIQLFVAFSPVVRTEKSVKGSQVGVDYVSLDCTIQASPFVNYFWYKDDYALTSINQRYTVTENKLNAYTVQTSLIIRNVSAEDAGVYRCKAGDREATTRLYVSQPTPKSTTTVPFTEFKRIIAAESTWQTTTTRIAVVTRSSTTTRLPIRDFIYKSHVAPEMASDDSSVSLPSTSLFFALFFISVISS